MFPTDIPVKPDSQAIPEYSTDQLYLAGWLLITQKLKYLGVRPDSKTQGRFYFADSDQIGLELEAEYLNSDPLVPIKQMRDILSLLRDQLRRGGVR